MKKTGATTVGASAVSTAAPRRARLAAPSRPFPAQRRTKIESIVRKVRPCVMIGDDRRPS